MTFKAFTEEQWQAIRALRDDWPDDIDWSENRRDIEGIGHAFWFMHNNRLQFGPPANVRKTLKNAQQQMQKLREALKALPEGLQPYVPNAGLKPLEAWLEGLLLAYDALAGPGFSGRSDYNRVWLYEALLDHWQRPLAGELRFSRKLDNTPYGALIDFLTLTVSAVLGKAPGPSQMAKIIEQYRK